MFKELLTHIPFHIGAHHVSLITDIIFTQTLDGIHQKQSGGNPWERLQNRISILSEQCFGSSSQNLGIREVHKTDNGGTEKVNKKDRFVRTIIMNEFLEVCMERSFQRSLN